MGSSQIGVVILFACIFFQASASTNCRFVFDYTNEDLANPTKQQQFLSEVFHWEGNFAKHMVGLNEVSGLTYDGHGIDYYSGVPAPGTLHYFSAPSKESIHLMMLARAIEGNSLALSFVCNYCTNQTAQINHAITLLTNKMNSYEKWNADYPGFAGFLPWYNNTDEGCTPNQGWLNQVPALDNGEWIWGLRAVAYVLNEKGYSQLSTRYLNYFNMLANNALMVFYHALGFVRAVTLIHDTSAQPTRSNYYQNEPCLHGCYLDDPYEGEMMTVFMDLYGNWTGIENQKNLLWVVKRPKLQKVTYLVNSPPTSITVQKGFWFSSHEQWKYLELPYWDSDINRRVFINGERARTWNSYQNSFPGMFASVNDVSTPPSTLIPDYLSATGIPSIAFEQILKNTTITPYSTFPLFLTGNTTAALLWYAAMLRGPSMQGIFGSTEACNTTGTAISPVLTWDSKITTLCAMLNGIVDITRSVLQGDGVYDDFVSRINYEWSRVFGDTLEGENLPFATPSLPIPFPGLLGDFTTCQFK